MAKFSRLGIIVILVYLSCERCRSCNYIIQDLSSAIEIDNNLDPNETIFTFTLLDTQDNNRTVTGQLLIPDQTQTDTNEYFTTITTGTFYITGLALGNKCPPPNTSETFYLTLRSDFACKYTVHVEVSATIPEFDIVPQVEILIDNQTTDPFTVIQFKLNDLRQCAKFNCSVTVRNSNKAFTIETGSFEVRTTLEYIRFDFTYVLDITCYIPDSAISDKHNTMVRVIFRTQITHTSPDLRVVSTDLTYKVTRTHLVPRTGARTSFSALQRTPLSVLSRTALSAVPKTVISTTPRSTVSVVVTTRISGKVSTRMYSTTFAPTSAKNLQTANNFIDTPSGIAAVCTGAGFVGLGAASVLTYHASRRCRSPRIVSQDGMNDQRVEENSQDVS